MICADGWRGPKVWRGRARGALLADRIDPLAHRQSDVASPSFSECVEQFLTSNDWPFGSALSMVLIAVMLVLLTLQTFANERASSGRQSEETAHG